MTNPLSNTEYSKIHYLIKKTLESPIEPIEKECVTFHLLAKKLIEQEMKLKTKVECGIALYDLGMPQLLSFYDGNPLFKPSGEQFHCYIIVEKEGKNYYIDFMAPIFNRITGWKIPEKILQKEIKDNKNVNEILNTSKIGDFSFVTDNQFTANEIRDKMSGFYSYKESYVLKEFKKFTNFNIINDHW